MDKELKIIPPEGYEVDKENSTFELIKFKPVKAQLPTTWEEFCETYPIKQGEYYVSSGSAILEASFTKRAYKSDKNLLPSKKYAEAIRALCQLIQLRDCYNDGWKPDWENVNEFKHTIYLPFGEIARGTHNLTSCVLYFKTKELRYKFLKNFRDLIEIAKPLL